MRLAKFVGHAIKDLPRMMKETHDDMLPYNTPRDIFNFVVVCKVVFERFKADYHVAH